ncbi:MAG TPA: LysR family transcriptional regulator [Rhodanobacteraceae bacterium]|nr:LysR family transcriptional regulator [Rhodanobacteraceae bacterium]
MDRIEAMSVLLAAVETGSLSGAGRKLGMPLPTVSRKVSELEAHLKARLLHRSTRRLTLTDSGRAYVEACKRILNDVEEAERAAAGEYSAPKGDLVITAPIVYGRLHVLPVVTEFLRAYPDVDIRLQLGDRMVNLFEEPVDLAVRIGDLPDSSLIATRVGSVHPVVCASAGYLSARGRPAHPDELTAHDCVTFEGLMSADTWNFSSGKSVVSAAIHSRLVVSTAEAAIAAAIAGAGITRVLSYQVADAVRTGALEIVLQEFEPAEWPVSLVYPSQGRLPLKLRAFLDYAVPRLKTRA